MNQLWSLLRCPACGDAPALELFSGTEAQPEEALLRSGCGLWFPVVDGIPRIFVGEMRSIYQQEFGAFLDRHGLQASTERESAETAVKLATRQSFGYEWTIFHEMLPEWEQASRFYLEPAGELEALAGQLVLDGGCGKGRQAYHMLEHGARLVAVDFSRAVEVAKKNCAGLDGERLFVQADLMGLPFAPGTFDLACSFGVLHHLPDPEAGFQRLVETVRPGGRALIYLYHALEGEPVKQALLRGVTAVRRMTVRLPHRVLLPLTTALGYLLYAGVVLPYRALATFPATQPLAEAMPLKSYARYPVRVIVNDQFDRFSAPIENRYRQDEVAGWLARAGLQQPRILGGAGWRAVGTRPA